MNEVEHRRLVAARIGAFLTVHSPSEVERETAIAAPTMSHLKRGDYRLSAWQAIRLSEAFPEFGAAWLLGVEDSTQSPFDFHKNGL
jgi:hypothetical protein